MLGIEFEYLQSAQFYTARQVEGAQYLTYSVPLVLEYWSSKRVPDDCRSTVFHSLMPFLTPNQQQYWSADGDGAR